MSDEKFKLPQSSYEELTKVIKAYGHFSEPKALDDVSKFIGLHPTVISRNAGFLTGVGILENGAKKSPTLNGKRLAHALEHEMPDEIRTWWRNVISESDFLTRLLAAIRIRNGMDQQTLEAHIAYSAGQPKKPQFMTGARTVIDILRAAELIKEANGKFIADQAQSAPLDVTSVSPVAEVSSPVHQTPHPDAIVEPQIITYGMKSGFILNIQININCTAGEVASLGPQIKKLIEELSMERSHEKTNAEQGE